MDDASTLRYHVNMGYESDVMIGQRVDARRKELGLTQTAVAERMTQRGHAWQQATYWKSVRGERKFLLTEAHALAAALEVPVTYLLGDDAAFEVEGAIHRAGFLAGLRHAASVIEELGEG